MAIGWKKVLLSLALGASVPPLALGEEPKGPPPALERLMKLEGHWVGDTRAVIEGRSYTVTYHADFRRTKDGSGLEMSEWFDSAELGAFRGENLIGYDPFTRKIRWFSVDNMGTTHEHVGDWTSETRFAMEHRGVRQGRKYVEKLSMDVQGEAIAVRLVGALGGKKTEELSGTLRRAPMQSSR
jgi:hypothetical protein